VRHPGTGPELAALGFLPPLAAAFLSGREMDLLAPLRFLVPGALPAGEPAPADRREVATALAAANKSYGHPQADSLAEKLADPAVRVVVTGQQPGLFGGPLYALGKAIAAARWAEALAGAGPPAVAVFWVATEDHDWAEVAQATLLAAEGPRRFELGPDPEPLAPLGARALGPGMARVLEEVLALATVPQHQAWWREVGRWYRPDARFGEAFARLFVRLLGPRCPLLLDAQLPQLKAAERSALARLVERRHEAEEAYRAADRRIEERGFPLQVAPQPGLSPLFLLDGVKRRRIEWRGTTDWVLRGGEREAAPVADLEAVIEDNPLAVSPGVLARSAVQDAVLGTFLQVLGPGELSYMAQAAAVYPVLGVPAPWLAARPQAVVLDPKELAWMGDLGLCLADLVGAEASLDRLLASRRQPDPIAPLRALLERELEGLKGPALALDPNLESPWRKTREQVLRALETFSGKLAAAAARADDTTRRRVEQLRAACLPRGEPQERVVSSAHFPARYGDRFAEALWEQLSLDPRNLQVIRP
jgi:bacillithiol biosynthesis cysteine-adding enzyme BshC